MSPLTFTLPASRCFAAILARHAMPRRAAPGPPDLRTSRGARGPFPHAGGRAPSSASASGKTSTVVRTGRLRETSKSSRPSLRVRLATGRTTARPRAARTGTRGCRSCGCPRRPPCRPCDGRERLRHELARGREDDRGVELVGPLADRTGPLGAERARARAGRRRSA